MPVKVDAGVILAGVPVAEVGAGIFEMVPRVASGERTKSEIAGVGDGARIERLIEHSLAGVPVPIDPGGKASFERRA